MNNMLPPHKHPFDWYLIPEIKGERGANSFIHYDAGKESWQCKLCEIGDHLSGSVEEHCHTWEHLQNKRRLDQRREELVALVKQREQQIWKELHERQQHEQAQVDFNMETTNSVIEEKKEPDPETREHSTMAPLLKKKPKKWETIDREVNQYYNSSTYRAASIRDRLLEDKLEDERDFEKTSMVKGESNHERIRRLRTQRLSGKHSNNALKDSSNRTNSVEARREERRREKETRRLANMELTRQHRERQQREEEQAAKERAEQIARNRFFASFCEDIPHSFTVAQTTCTDIAGQTSYLCGFE